MYNLVLYTTDRGDSPVDEFLDGLDKKSRAKVAAHLSLLEEQGPNLKRPYADVVRGKIRELMNGLRYSQILSSPMQQLTEYSTGLISPFSRE